MHQASLVAKLLYSPNYQMPRILVEIYVECYKKLVYHDRGYTELVKKFVRGAILKL